VGSSSQSIEAYAERDRPEPAASRRSVLLSAAVVAAAAVPCLSAPGPAAAIQGITAGRLPGVSKDTDAEGFLTYQRPEGKSGGHGVGWSEIPRYSFKLPEGWEETPVSIADLGGTEIDLRYASKGQGDVIVIVAPVLRFKDIGFNADVTLEDLGPPDRLILGFAPELIGGPLPDDAVSATEVVQKEGHTYYQWEVEVAGAKKPYHYVSMTAVGNRAFLLATAANPRQWRAAKEKLRTIQQSFFVPPKTA